MDSHLIPVKTPQGHDELSTRQRRLGPRFRTMLLLVDGERTVKQVLDLSFKAGVPMACFQELVSMGLVVVPRARPAPSRLQESMSSGTLEGKTGHKPVTSDDDSDSFISTVAADSGLDGHDEMAGSPLEDARYLLLHAVGTEAKLTGALTMLRLKRARSPLELLALLSEVEARIGRPDRAIATRQLMGRVAQLLSQAEARQHVQVDL